MVVAVSRFSCLGASAARAEIALSHPRQRYAGVTNNIGASTRPPAVQTVVYANYLGGNAATTRNAL